MPIQVSDKQLDQMENDRSAAVIVRSERTNKGYSLIPESVYARLRPLLQFVAIDLVDPVRGQDRDAATEWTPELNARRVMLINKKHDKGLTPAEKKELKQLMAQADAHRDAAASVRNQILELILAGLRTQSPKPSTR
ncbi:hypothetical protein BH10PLA2_BH10PLA2_11190 [soil metagenome]